MRQHGNQQVDQCSAKSQAEQDQSVGKASSDDAGILLKALVGKREAVLIVFLLRMPAPYCQIDRQKN